MLPIIIGTACLILGLMIVLVVGILAARSFLGKAKEKGVNVFDGITPEELVEMARIFRDLRKSELQLRVAEKLRQATTTIPVEEQPPRAAPTASPARKS